MTVVQCPHLGADVSISLKEIKYCLLKCTCSGTNSEDCIQQLSSTGKSGADRPFLKLAYTLNQELMKGIKKNYYITRMDGSTVYM